MESGQQTLKMMTDSCAALKKKEKKVKIVARDGS